MVFPDDFEPSDPKKTNKKLLSCATMGDVLPIQMKAKMDEESKLTDALKLLP